VIVVVTEVKGHAPQVVGARMLVGDEGLIAGTIGGGALEHAAVAAAREVLESGQPTKRRFMLKAELGMCCGGSMEVFMDPLPSVPRLVLFGAGHVALPTAKLAAQVGFSVTVVDQRAELNHSDRFGTCHREVVPPLRFVHEHEPFGPLDYLVICTHDHALDKALLRQVLTSDARYVGMIGSRRKVKSARRELLLADIPQERIDTVHAPIGLDILAETPDEIAVAIVGELIRHRRQPSSRKQTRGSEVRSLRGSEAEG
jgi:xanthine dehydrogenase accessory factor